MGDPKPKMMSCYSVPHSYNASSSRRTKTLLRITAAWQRAGRDFAGVAFGIQEDLDIGGTIEYLELIANVLPTDEMRNRVYTGTSVNK
jgi:hypothetical protein